MADFAVSTAFTSKDGITSALKRMGAAADKFGQRSGRAFGRANKAGLTFKKTLGAILSAQVIGRGTALIQQGMRTIGEEFVSFDDAITQAGAKFPQMVKRGSEGFARMEAVAREVGATTKFSATEAAEGLNFLAMAGFSAEKAMAALPQLTNLAVASNMDLARATDIASDALGAFNLMTDDSAQLTKNLARINDVFARTVTSANVDMEMLFETMKDGGPVATAAGASIETFAALTGKMADAGIKGSKAGTTLKNMFLALQSPTPKAAAELKRLRINAIDPATGSMRDIIDVLGEFNEKTKNMGKAQKAAAIDTIFGKRAIAGVNVLLAQGSDRLKDYRQKLIDSTGSAQTMADEIGKSLGNRLKALRSAAIEIGFKFIDAFKDKIPGAIDSAIEAVRRFDVKSVIDDIKAIISFSRKLIGVIETLSPVIVGLVTYWVAYSVALKAALAIGAIAKFMSLYKTLNLVKAAQIGLNVAMTANPIGVVVAAVAGLVTAGVMLYRQWDNIKLLFNFLWEDLKGFWRWLTNTKFFQLAQTALGFLGAKKKAVAKPMVKKPVEEMTAADFAFQKAQQEKLRRDKLREQLKQERIRRQLAKVKAPGRATVRGFAPAPGAPAREAPPAARIAPNKEDVAAQKVQFEGKLQIAGAPPGTTIETKTRGAPPVKTEIAGANI